MKLFRKFGKLLKDFFLYYNIWQIENQKLDMTLII